jgi:hypothetical protein
MDFLVIADHAENLGLAPLIAQSDPAVLANPWGKKVHDMIKTGNEPGQFKAMIGFEWTSGPNGDNLHRNVLFRDGKLPPVANTVNVVEATYTNSILLKETRPSFAGRPNSRAPHLSLF